MKRLIAAPSAGCPQWSVAVMNDSASRGAPRGAPPADWTAFGDGPTLAAALIAAAVAAEEQEG